MTNTESLSNLITLNSDFRNAINLYLSLNKKDKVLSYIPTKSSVNILLDYLEAIKQKKEQATLLVGPYGKGKSHLMLVLLAILSMERNKDNQKVIDELINKIKKIDEVGDMTADLISEEWKKGKYLPVIVNSSDDLNQSFLIAMNEALKREGLEDLIPETSFSYAIESINKWEKNYPATYKNFVSELKKHVIDEKIFIKELEECNGLTLKQFMKIYPELTSGSEFNPMANSEVLPLYKSICEKLQHDYGFSGIYIVFDEFSKFIEEQKNLSTGSNMKLLQDLCELSSDMRNGQLRITMIAHKSIKEYGATLSQEIINSFTGIEGRITEKRFITSSKNNYELIQNAIVKNKDIDKHINFSKFRKSYGLSAFKTNFNEKDYENIVLRGCFPLTPAAAYLLLNISEKVAQNERTLFTFISKDEQNSMARFVKNHRAGENEWIGADLIYDYFSNLFKKDVQNELVHNEWLNAEYAISKVSKEDKRSEEKIKLIKYIAIINIANIEDEISTMKNDLQNAIGCEVGECLEDLEKDNLLYKKGSSNTYVFKTRSGAELKKEINRRYSLLNHVNLSAVFSDIDDSKYVLANKYNIDNKMTRYFVHEYMDYDSLLNIQDASVLLDDVCDGKIISVYSETKKDNQKIKEWVSKQKEQRLIVQYSNEIFDLKDKAKEYEVIKAISNDIEFARANELQMKEIPIIEEDVSSEICSKLENMFGKENSVICTYPKKRLKTNNSDLVEAVDDVCYNVFSKTPVINNEMINKNVINVSSTKKTQKLIVDKLLSKEEITEAYYLGSSQESTIFRAVFVVTNLLEGKQNNELTNVIEIINNFIDSCVDKKHSMDELVNTLKKSPYGLRVGVIPLLFAYALSKRNEDIVVYFADFEVSLSSDIVLKMCENPSDFALFISKESAEKEKYIANLQKLFDTESLTIYEDNRIVRIFNAMSRWYRSLPQISRQVKDFGTYGKKKGMAEKVERLRNRIQRNAGNPFEMIFVNLANDFGSENDFNKTYETIKNCKSYLDGYYEWLSNEVVLETINVFNGKKNDDLYHLMKEWYAKQSTISKQGLFSVQVTTFMTTIDQNNSFDDRELAIRLAKIVTNVYLDSWNENTLNEYVQELKRIKNEVESIQDNNNDDKKKLVFIGKDGTQIEKYYEQVDEGTGDILRNLLEDTLEDFEDMSANDKVAILLEMIEKISN